MNLFGRNVLAYDLKSNKGKTITEGLSRPQSIIIDLPDYLAVADLDSGVLLFKNDALVHTIKNGESLTMAIAR